MAKKNTKSPARRTPPRKAAKKAAPRKAAPRKAARAKRSPAVRRRSVRPAVGRASVADVRGADVRRDVGGVRLEVGRAGNGRVKRMIYPPGFKWSTDIRPHVETDYCMHAHVGFLVSGRIDVIYADGCVEVYEGPQIVAVAPGHDGHVVGKEPAVLIEFDFEGDTISRFGMPDAHRHE
jgi:mannose-6-phosphate isomerase-like protein (cupin superfamily)